MNFKEFMHKVLEAFPNAEVGEDADRQLVIYTNLMPDPDTEPGPGSDADYMEVTQIIAMDS